MKRLCFLFPDVEHTRNGVEALRHAGIDESNIMIVAKRGTPLEDLPAAGIDKSDAIPGLKRGLAAGGIIGAVAGVTAMEFTELGLLLGGAAIPWFALIGAGISGFMTLLGGASVPSSRLKRFEEAVEHQGKILLMVDVKEERMQEIETLLKAQTPESDFVGLEPRAPMLPP